MVFDAELWRSRSVLMYALIRNKCQPIFIGDTVEVKKERYSKKRKGKTVVDVIKGYYPELEELKGEVIDVFYVEEFGNITGRNYTRLNMLYTIETESGKKFSSYHYHLRRLRQFKASRALEKYIKKEENKKRR